VIWVPGHVSAEDRRLLEELRRSERMKQPRPGKTIFERVKDALGG